MVVYERILSFEGIFTGLTYLSYLEGHHVLVPFADISKTSGKTEMALTQRFSNSAKTSAI